MQLIETKRDDYYRKGLYVCKQEGIRPGGLIPFVLGASVVWVPPVFFAATFFPMLITALSIIAIVAGSCMMIEGDFKSLFVSRKEKKIDRISQFGYASERVVAHPKYQEAIRDYEMEKKWLSPWPSETPWIDVFDKLNDTIEENLRLTEEQNRTIKEDVRNYHVDVEVHNEMMRPVALEMPVESKPKDPKSLGVNFHVHYKEIEAIKLAIKRDPNFKDPVNSALYKRLLKAESKLDTDGWKLCHTWGNVKYTKLDCPVCNAPTKEIHSKSFAEYNYTETAW